MYPKIIHEFHKESVCCDERIPEFCVINFPCFKPDEQSVESEILNTRLKSPGNSGVKSDLTS